METLESGQLWRWADAELVMIIEPNSNALVDRAYRCLVIYPRVSPLHGQISVWSFGAHYMDLWKRVA